LREFLADTPGAPLRDIVGDTSFSVRCSNILAIY
jgi:hypothetical protein